MQSKGNSFLYSNLSPLNAKQQNGILFVCRSAILVCEPNFLLFAIYVQIKNTINFWDKIKKTILPGFVQTTNWFTFQIPSVCTAFIELFVKLWYAIIFNRKRRKLSAFQIKPESSAGNNTPERHCMKLKAPYDWNINDNKARLLETVTLITIMFKRYLKRKKYGSIWYMQIKFIEVKFCNKIFLFWRERGFFSSLDLTPWIVKSNSRKSLPQLIADTIQRVTTLMNFKRPRKSECVRFTSKREISLHIMLLRGVNENAFMPNRSCL